MNDLDSFKSNVRTQSRTLNTFNNFQIKSNTIQIYLVFSLFRSEIKDNIHKKEKHESIVK